jgi:hypothetical protein
MEKAPSVLPPTIWLDTRLSGISPGNCSWLKKKYSGRPNGEAAHACGAGSGLNAV